MATIEPYDTTKGRRYRVRYRTPDHRQTDKRGFTTLRDAKAFAASVEVAKLDGTYVKPSAGRATIGQLGKDRLEHRKSTLKPSTWRSEETAWRVHVEPRWGDVPVGQVKTSAVKTWIHELTTTGNQAKRKADDTDPRALSATIVVRCHGILSGVLDDAVTDQLIPRNPAAGVPLPRRTATARGYLTHAQVDALAAQTTAVQHATIVYVLAYTGIRWGELTALRVRHLDMLRRRIQVAENAVTVGQAIEVGTPKTHEQRTVPFPPFLAERLAAQCVGRARDDLVFGEPGEWLRRPSVNRGWFAMAVQRAQAADATFPSVTPHDLRHTAASLAVQAGAHVKALQRMLGHASASMTLDRYSDLFDDDLDAVATALDRARSSSSVGKSVGKPASGE